MLVNVFNALIYFDVTSHNLDYPLPLIVLRRPLASGGPKMLSTKLGP